MKKEVEGAEGAEGCRPQVDEWFRVISIPGMVDLGNVTVV